MIKFESKDCIEVETVIELKDTVSKLKKLGVTFEVDNLYGMLAHVSLLLYPTTGTVSVVVSSDEDRIHSYKEFLNLIK